MKNEINAMKEIQIRTFSSTYFSRNRWLSSIQILQLAVCAYAMMFFASVLCAKPKVMSMADESRATGMYCSCVVDTGECISFYQQDHCENHPDDGTGDVPAPALGAIPGPGSVICTDPTQDDILTEHHHDKFCAAASNPITNCDDTFGRNIVGCEEFEYRACYNDCDVYTETVLGVTVSIRQCSCHTDFIIIGEFVDGQYNNAEGDPCLMGGI